MLSVSKFVGFAVVQCQAKLLGISLEDSISYREARVVRQPGRARKQNIPNGQKLNQIADKKNTTKSIKLTKKNCKSPIREQKVGGVISDNRRNLHKKQNNGLNKLMRVRSLESCESVEKKKMPAVLKKKKQPAKDAEKDAKGKKKINKHSSVSILSKNLGLIQAKMKILKPNDSLQDLIQIHQVEMHKSEEKKGTRKTPSPTRELVGHENGIRNKRSFSYI